MSTIVQTSPVTAAYLAELADRTGRPVGDAAKPTGIEGLYPYVVLHVGTVRTDGDIVHPHQDGLHRVQATCVGLTRKSVEWLRDRCREVLADKSVVIDGYVIVWTESAGSPPVFREDEPTPPVTFSAVEVRNVYVTPTSGS